jgi:hypothetical protein
MLTKRMQSMMIKAEIGAIIIKSTKNWKKFLNVVSSYLTCLQPVMHEQNQLFHCLIDRNSFSQISPRFRQRKASWIAKFASINIMLLTLIANSFRDRC